MYAGLRPTRSLTFAQITRPARGFVKQSNFTVEGTSILTGICNQVCGHHPASSNEVIQVVGNRYEGGADDGEFEVYKEQS